MNPTGAEHTLTPGPEALPTTLIHVMGDAKGETLEGGKDCEFFDSGIKESRRCLVELRLSAGKTLYSFRQFEIANLPPEGFQCVSASLRARINSLSFAARSGKARILLIVASGVFSMVIGCRGYFFWAIGSRCP